jgi:hypothetical protein
MAWGAEDSVRFGGTGSLPWDTTAIRSTYINESTSDSDHTNGKCLATGSGADSVFDFLAGSATNGTLDRDALFELSKMDDTFGVLTGEIIDSAFLRVCLYLEGISASGSIILTLVGMEYKFTPEWVCDGIPTAGGPTWNCAIYPDQLWNSEYELGPTSAGDTLGNFSANDITINDGASANTWYSFKIDTSFIRQIIAGAGYTCPGVGLYPNGGSGLLRSVNLYSEHSTGTYATYRPYVVVYYHLAAASSGARRLRIINGG